MLQYLIIYINSYFKYFNVHNCFIFYETNINKYKASCDMNTNVLYTLNILQVLIIVLINGINYNNTITKLHHHYKSYMR